MAKITLNKDYPRKMAAMMIIAIIMGIGLFAYTKGEDYVYRERPADDSSGPILLSDNDLKTF